MSAGTPNTADELREALSGAFEHDPRIDLHQSPIRIRVEGDRLILEGQVQDVTTLRRARALAEQYAGEQRTVEDRLRRRPVEPMGDRELRDEAIGAFTDEPVFAGYTLRTHTGSKAETVHDGGPDAGRILVAIEEPGTITLSGSVGSLSHRRLAEALMWWIRGCEAVDNCLEVDPPEEDSDDEINDAVRIVLEKDPMVRADQLRVGTAAGIVHLDGAVATEDERRFAVGDCFAVPGVYDVLDRLQVSG
ncbi:MAG: BON domain-containing protein [Guyparkeria sp.]|uniref:BON domain-containing protein n=1 Tax=Guyparkeria sp. TaxID=2035736 RepID=UPI00397C7AFB